MDLFTYLMSKNDYNTSIHGDLFAYLLGKAQGGGGQIKTASGVTINIPDAKKLVSFMMTKESTQDGTPTPDNPVPVNVVEGYRNLFDKNNFDSVTNIYINLSSNIYSSGSSGIKTLYMRIPQEVKTYSVSKVSSNVFRLATSPNIPEANGTISSRVLSNTNTFLTITSTINDNYLAVSYYQSTTDTLTEQQILDSIMIVEGNQKLPYVPYGNNYIAVNVSDGNTTNSYPIPLNNNEIAGQGDNLDELKVDKSGHVWLNKKYPKYIFTGEEEYGYSEQTNSVFFIRDITDFQRSNNIPLCNYYLGKINTTNASAASNRGNNSICFVNNPNGNFLYIVDNRYTTKEDFKNWVKERYINGTPLVIRYATNNPQPIDLNTTVDLKLFKGVNNVSNSEDGYMTIEYQ